MKFKSSGRGSADFWNGTEVKASKSKYKSYQANYKFRLDKYLREPFELETAPPITCSGLLKSVGSTEVIASIPHKFDAADIARYKALNEKASSFIAACKTEEAISELRDLLALDYRFLQLCNALPEHLQSRKVLVTEQPASAAAVSAVLSGGRGGDDDSDDRDGETTGMDAEDGAGSGAPAAGADDPHDFKKWQHEQNDMGYMSFEWSDMGYNADDLKSKKSWFAACILFFYIDELARKFPQVSNVLHAGWQTIFTKPMDAASLATPPLEYDQDEIGWCTKTTKLLQRLLDDDGRSERGLEPLQLEPVRVARTKASTQLRAATASSAARDLGAQTAGASKRKRCLLTKLRNCQDMLFTESMLAGRLRLRNLELSSRNLRTPAPL